MNREDICHIAIVGLRPDVRIGARVDQLRVQSHSIADALHVTLQKMRHAELLTDLARVPRVSTLIEARGSATDHLEVCDLCEIGKNFILHAGREVGVLFVVSQVLERQHRDAFFGDGIVRG